MNGTDFGPIQQVLPIGTPFVWRYYSPSNSKMFPVTTFSRSARTGMSGISVRCL